MKTAAERAGWNEARVNAAVLGHGESNEGRVLLVRPGGQTSNSLLDTLADWGAYLDGMRPI